jgi:PKD repeat protein
MRNKNVLGLLPGLVAVLAMATLDCGGDSGGGTTGSSNGAPSGSFTVSPQTPALMGATSVTFLASATDPDADAITYQWDFGDGTSQGGQSVSHVFMREGALNVVLTMRDAKGAQTTAASTVTVKSLTGHWVDIDPRYQVDLVQTGSSFTGSVSASGFGRVSDVSSGRVNSPRSVAFHRQSFIRGFATVDYTGSLDASLDQLNVVAIQNSRTSFNLMRQ